MSRVEYSDPKDAEVIGYPGVRMSAAYFEFPGGTLLELFEYLEPASAPPESSETFVVGNAHVGLVLDDLDAACERIRRFGTEFRSPAPVPLTSGAHAGGRSIYIRDPDGDHDRAARTARRPRLNRAADPGGTFESARHPLAEGLECDADGLAVHGARVLAREERDDRCDFFRLHEAAGGGACLACRPCLLQRGSRPLGLLRDLELRCRSFSPIRAGLRCT